MRERRLLSQISSYGKRTSASVDDDTGTVYLEKLSAKRRKIEDSCREIRTNAQREDYLKVMNQMYEKYASLEQKISKMTEKKWDTERVISGIEQDLDIWKKKRIAKANLQKIKTNVSSVKSQSVNQVSHADVGEQMSPQKIFQVIE